MMNAPPWWSSCVPAWVHSGGARDAMIDPRACAVVERKRVSRRREPVKRKTDGRTGQLDPLAAHVVACNKQSQRRAVLVRLVSVGHKGHVTVNRNAVRDVFVV